ncbi:uncharacterized protein (TIGR00369 family) [Caulobacter ginsengisoli]|uniref:Uncharacterized protein (TIGR00369 family) n=1 Tax=Caulobacter ginsengisoli TaxID=400775 RepID=A0ABU0J032_9CAUL|nr:PaaI family thioesterase [Caulobacter ginsengisoli]MDQ0466562.1 uncharacterized protein (TIGR00369 family) [Caulobacter ginsengisoli]
MSDAPPPLTPAASLLGREVLEIDLKERLARVAYLARDEFANRHGTVQGGFLAAMLDSACGIAVTADLPEGMTAVTRRLDTSFIRPARIGRLIVEARVIRREGRAAEVEAQLMDEAGVVLAKARAELRTMEQRDS